MPKASKKKRIKVLRGVLRQVRVELYKIYTPDGQRNLDGAPIDLVAHLVAKKFTNLTKRMDDLEEAFSTMEDAEPIRQLLLKELGDGSGSESREGMNTLELVELLAKRYRRSERASRDWQNHASEQAEQLTKIKTELLSVCSRPDERLTPLEVADTVAESVRLLREMLEESKGALGSSSGLRGDVVQAIARLAGVLTPDQAGVYAESGVSVHGYASFVASQLAGARSTIKDLNRVNAIVREKIAEVLPTAGTSGYLPTLVENLVNSYKLRGKLFLEQQESFKNAKASLGDRITELHVSDVDVLDEAHRLVGAAGDESLSNQDLIVGLIAIVRSLKEEPSRDQPAEPAVRPAEPAVRPADPDPADPDPTAVPG